MSRLPDTFQLLVLSELDEYTRTGNGEHLLEAVRQYLQYSKAPRELQGAFRRALDRWHRGRTDPWDPGSAAVRCLCTAFKVEHRSGNWKPSAASALVSPVSSNARKSPGEVDHCWSEIPKPLKGRRLTPADIPPGVTLAHAVVWVVDILLARKWIATTNKKHPRSAFREAERLLAWEPGDRDGRTRGNRGHLGAKAIEKIYYERRPHRKPALKGGRKSGQRKRRSASS
ncbi:hypothetical protein ACFL6M_04445 [Candidatus Eisenbacteria bacterium]|uniref:Uncharacterized protein n=1 Tax=Eiseniibacteriota bacterium TaxID=2212470 RepID=A0ABV6YKI8_UNCEI